MKQLLIILLIWGCIACVKDEPRPYLVPDPVFFLIQENGAKLPDSTLGKMKMFYLKDNTKKYISDFEKGIDGFDTLGILTTRNIGFTSGNENIKGFYLEYPDGDIDTLYVDYRHLTSKEGSKNPCYCNYPLEEVRFNGKKAELDPTITMQPVYLFQKH